MLDYFASDGRHDKILAMGKTAPVKAGGLTQKRGTKRARAQRDASEASERSDLPLIPWFRELAPTEATHFDEQASADVVAYGKNVGNKETDRGKEDIGEQVKAGKVKKRQGDSWWKWIREGFEENIEKKTYVTGGIESTGVNEDNNLQDETTTQRNATPT